MFKVRESEQYKLEVNYGTQKKWSFFLSHKPVGTTEWIVQDELHNMESMLESVGNGLTVMILKERDSMNLKDFNMILIEYLIELGLAGPETRLKFLNDDQIATFKRLLDAVKNMAPGQKFNIMPQ